MTCLLLTQCKWGVQELIYCFLTGPRGPGKKSKAFNERGVALSCHRLGDPTSFYESLTALMSNDGSSIIESKHTIDIINFIKHFQS